MENTHIKLAYDEIGNVKILFQEYITMLGEDLTFQDYENELKNLPGKYKLPKGRLYTAYFENELAGCIALRPLEGNKCEMKRLYVRPKFRGKKIGKLLANMVIEDAIVLGYKSMLLDTLISLNSAVHLYKSLGFKEIAPYYYNPLKDVLYFELVF